MRWVALSILLIVSYTLQPVFAEDILLGRIPDPDNHQFTILHLFRGLLFAVAIFAFVGLKYYKTKNQKFFLLSISCFMLLTFTSVSVGEFLSVLDFSNFSNISIILAIAFLCTSSYTMFLSLPDKNIVKNKEIIVTGIICSMFIMVSLLSIYNIKTASYILMSIWGASSLIAFLYIITQSIRGINDIQSIVYVGLLWGGFLALGTGGPTNIVGIALRGLGWISCYACLLQMLLIVYKKNKDFINYSNNNYDDFWLEYNIGTKEIILSKKLIELLALKEIRKTFTIKQFKSLVLKKDQHILENALIDSQDRQSKSFSFYGISDKFVLHRIYTEDNNTKPTKFLLLTEDKVPLDQENDDPFSYLEDVDNIIVSQSGLDFFKSTIIKNAMGMRSKSGNMCFTILRVTNFDVLLFEAGRKSSDEIIDIILEKINEKASGFDDFVSSKISHNEIGLFFYSQNHKDHILKLRKIISNILSRPMECILGKFFAHYSYGIAIEDTEKILYDPDFKFVQLMIDNCYKDLLVKRNFYDANIIEKEIDLPKGATISSLSSDLCYAPEKHQIDTHFRAVWNIKENIIKGIDSSPAWLHPDYGTLAQDIISKMSDYTNYHSIIERIVMIKAIERLKYWQDYLLDNNLFTILHVSKNGLKTINRTSGDILQLIKKLNSLPESKLKLSTRSINICFDNDCLLDEALLSEIINILKGRGFIISLNNFGRGQADIYAATKYPFDQVIFDKSYCNNIGDERNLFVLETKIKTLQNISIKIGIDGVENTDIIPILNRLNIDYILGKACSDYLPASGMMSFLNHNYKHAMAS